MFRNPSWMVDIPFYHPLSLAFLPSLPMRDYDIPIILPSIAVLNPMPLQHLNFVFEEEVLENAKTLRSCTKLMNLADKIVRTNMLYQHTCLLLQAGSQASMRLFKGTACPKRWTTNFEIPFCHFLSKTGKCPRELDVDNVNLIQQWLGILIEILEPLQNVLPENIPVIAPVKPNPRRKERYFSDEYY